MARLDTQTFHRWLKGYILAEDSSLKVVTGKMEDMPDRMVAIRRGVARGKVMEGLYESVRYQIESRGGQNNLDDAENIAEMIDKIILDKASNVFFEDCHLLTAEWAGSGLQQLVLNDPQSRYSYVCDYTITSSME